MNEEKILILNIKNWMKENKKTQTDLAELVGFHPTYISANLNEKSTITWEIITKVSEVTKKSVAELFTPLEKQLPFQQIGEAVELSNKNELIKLLNSQIEELKTKMQAKGTGDRKAKLVIENNEAKLIVNGLDIEVDEIDDLDIYERELYARLKVDEIVSK